MNYLTGVITFQKRSRNKVKEIKVKPIKLDEPMVEKRSRSKRVPRTDYSDNKDSPSTRTDYSDNEDSPSTRTDYSDDEEHPRTEDPNKDIQDEDPGGLITAYEVTQICVEEVAVLFVQETPDPDIEEFLKPSFEEPPLYRESEPHTEEQSKLLEELLRKNSKVFRTTLPNVAPPFRKGDTPMIKLVEGATPIKKPAYRMSPTQNNLGK